MGGGRDGRLFEAGRLLTFSAFRMGGYSRWALIRGWALIRINTVLHSLVLKKPMKPYLCLFNLFYFTSFLLSLFYSLTYGI